VTTGQRPAAEDRPRSAAAGPSDERRLEAPHRRGGSSPRGVERLAVLAYRGTAALLGVLPAGPTSAVAGLAAQLSYLVWPTKRRWSNRNFGHVLGLPPDHPQVRAVALRAYRTYGRYLVELMRLPSLSREELGALVPTLDLEEAERIWRATDGRGLILAVAHMGSNEAVGASMAGHGLPISVVADDSSFPELFDHLRRQREAWGFRLIPWRNLREIFGVLRRGELLGLLVDWGYRPDGVPVRFFGTWTTLPAGPATLAGKTGARILPITIRRQADGTYHVGWPDPIDVPSTDPADIQRATQAIADALATNIAGAPDQWYSFKPIWPADPDEIADLERRARQMQAGMPDPGPGATGPDVR
jgi:phosphatidylinositol dimannoside acyltransferase